MNSRNRNIILNKMLEQLELPPTAYDKAKSRYEDLGEWFSRPESKVSQYDPHIFSQGSFRLGTAIRPLNEDEPYDLDLGCKLRKTITIETHTQKTLKELVGEEMESYRAARRIQNKLIPKHRCWRLEYQDELSFHMDMVPSIPSRETKSKSIAQLLMNSGVSKEIAFAETESTSVITDDRHPSYAKICDDWKISNPEGYAKWFERKLQQFDLTRNALEKSKVDKLPLFKRKTPLQQVIQLLKRHRDQMFIEDGEAKPISIIITTLSTHAYSGEQDLAEALTNILSKMENHIRQSFPRVPNPVDPEEDFADRWHMPACKHLNLEKNFWGWLQQAKVDFEAICSSERIDFIGGQVKKKFGAILNESDLAKSLGLAHPTSVSYPPKSHVISEPAPPWMAESSEE